MGGLQGGDFYFSLTRNPLETYKDLVREATSYSRTEQLNLARKATFSSVSETRTTYPHKEKRLNDYDYDRSAKNKRGEPGPTTQRGEGRPDRNNQYTNYTPLNKPNGEIFAVIPDELPSPRRIKFAYRDYGHHTDNYY
ncbi:unnamed protein product [Prunus armeniaca]|uniref:Uncharacterized protein n=1 Tax=Prunus armeniaca TaxID=36596 RepID=A0A6J5WK18_PRUAR|nr:unnamed protein product [Prunus armeniaca]